jgi:hypothetical protein
VNDPNYAAQKRRIRRLIDKWHKSLGMGWWSLDIKYSNTTRDDGDDYSTVLMAVHTDWEYRKAAITVHIPSMFDVSNEDLEKCVVHELCHVLVNEMHDWTLEDPGKKHEERVVCGLADAFLWTRNAGKDDAKKERAKKK